MSSIGALSSTPQVCACRALPCNLAKGAHENERVVGPSARAHCAGRILDLLICAVSLGPRLRLFSARRPFLPSLYVNPMCASMDVTLAAIYSWQSVRQTSSCAEPDAGNGTVHIQNVSFQTLMPCPPALHGMQDLCGHPPGKHGPYLPPQPPTPRHDCPNGHFAPCHRSNSSPSSSPHASSPSGHGTAQASEQHTHSICRSRQRCFHPQTRHHPHPHPNPLVAAAGWHRYHIEHHGMPLRPPCLSHLHHTGTGALK
jgi:hypothetical protein